MDVQQHSSYHIPPCVCSGRWTRPTVFLLVYVLTGEDSEHDLPYSSLCMFWQVKSVRIRFRCPARSWLSVSRSSGCSDGWKLPSQATSSSSMASTSTPYKACRSPGGRDVHIQECVTDQAAVFYDNVTSQNKMIYFLRCLPFLYFENKKVVWLLFVWETILISK